MWKSVLGCGGGEKRCGKVQRGRCGRVVGGVGR